MIHPSPTSLSSHFLALRADAWLESHMSVRSCSSQQTPPLGQLLCGRELILSPPKAEIQSPSFQKGQEKRCEAQSSATCFRTAKVCNIGPGRVGAQKRVVLNFNIRMWVLKPQPNPHFCTMMSAFMRAMF